MNTRSIRFRLTAWYAGLLAGLLLLFGIFVYLTLEQFLEKNLRQSLADQAQTIGQTLIANVDQSGDAYVVNEIEEHFAPRITGRFVRVSRADGSVLYQSGPPKNGSFDPSHVPAATFNSPSWREEEHSGEQELLIHAGPFAARNGNRYLIETGAPYDQVERVLRGLLLSLGIVFPLIVAVAIGGGYALMRRALKPFDDIATTAERITSRSLNERVPESRTGDELEKLSVSLNRMMGRLEEAFHLINRFSADASHELRTPLAIIRGELEQAVQARELTPELRETIGSTLEEIERLSRIVEQLLAMARLETGEALIERTRLDLAELAKTTVEQMQLLAEQKKLQLQFRATAPVNVEGDRFRLKQVVVNLVDNAINYTPAGGSVSVSVATSTSGHAVLEVADTGIGVPSEALPQIFDRFFRADPARSRQLGGAGLGLAIVKSICVAHGGTVTVRSADGEGAVFRVELPLVSSDQREESRT